MTTITITVSDATNDALKKLAERCGQSNDACDGANTHGPLDVARLVTMLAEDAAMAVLRPGSWEGLGILDVLNAHGYEV